MDDKITPLNEAVWRFVSDGDHVALGGWVITRCVVAVVHELIRRRKRNLTVSQGVAGFDTDLLVGSRAVNHLITSGGSLDAFGRLNRINEASVKGHVDVEDYSALSMASKFLAGALGLPYLPSRSLLGSSILEDLKKRKPPVTMETKCPFTGEPLVLLRAINPKTAIVHVQRADGEGNAQIFGPLWDTQPIVGAAERVLLTTDEIVDSSEIINQPERTTIPGFKVVSVSPLPMGAYPTSCYRYYDYDAEEIKSYVKASKDPEGFEAYVNENILAHETFQGYLDSVCPQERRAKLRADPLRGY